MKTSLFLFLSFMLSGVAIADDHAEPTVYGQYFSIVVSDTDAVIDAMKAYRQSATGKKLSSTVTLSANLANGTDQATHTITVFHPSAAAMEADIAAYSGSADRAAFLDAMGEVAEVESENVFTEIRGKINDENLSGAGVATMLFGITALDPARYNAALETIINSKAAAAFPGNLFSGAVVAMGEDAGTHWVSFQAKDIGTLLSGVETFMNSSDFAKYAKNADEFRKVEGRYISRAVLTMGPQ